MHSSTLRGTDFEMIVEGRAQTHADYFRGFTRTKRLGIAAPNRIDGAGAGNLVLAYVTAFYDDYRAESEKFYAYPDFFSFQQTTPLANYGSFDFWPDHKNVHVERDAAQVLQAITDRGVNVLVVPDGEPREHEFHDVALASVQRNIERCYIYCFEGRVTDADITIRCARSPLGDWTENLFDTLEDDPQVQQYRRAWLDQNNANDHLEQSYRRVTLDEALARL